MESGRVKNAYSFLRWSTKGQNKENRDSRARQTASAEKWINEHSSGKYQLAKEVFISDGQSAYKGKHIAKDEHGKAKGELRRFMDLVEEGTINKDSILLIDSWDRFSRLNATQSWNLFSEVLASGIGLVFTGSHEKRVITSALIDKEPHILYYILGEMIRANTESAEKSRKIISAKAKKKAIMEAGTVVAHNNIPKYFTYVPITKTEGKYIHNENTGIVQGLIDGILAGKSLYWLANDLNERQIKTFRKGYQWSGNSVRQILRNTTLHGEYLGNADYVKPIVDKDKFDRIQNILNGNKMHRGKASEFVNVFRGVCFCSHCNHSMSVQTQKAKGRVHRYLRCSVGGLGKAGSCKNRKHIKLNAVENAFFWHFLGQHPYELINEDDKAEIKEVNKLKTACQTKINKINSQIAKFTSLEDETPLPELKSILAKLNMERDKANSEMDALNVKTGLIQDAPQNFREIIGKTMDFDTGAEKPIYDFDDAKLDAALKDNKAREQIRLAIPSIIGKMTVDANEGRFYVYSRMGKMIFKSVPIVSSRNNSEVWKKSLKTWTKRKLTNGKVITCNRKQSND